MCEGGRKTREDLRKLGSQQRCGDVGRNEVEEVDDGGRSLLVCNSLGSNLAGEERQEGCEIRSWSEFRLLLLECVFDRGEYHRSLKYLSIGESKMSKAGNSPAADSEASASPESSSVSPLAT